jgi:hypothetical protein
MKQIELPPFTLDGWLVLLAILILTIYGIYLTIKIRSIPAGPDDDLPWIFRKKNGIEKGHLVIGATDAEGLLRKLAMTDQGGHADPPVQLASQSLMIVKLDKSKIINN